MNTKPITLYQKRNGETELHTSHKPEVVSGVTRQYTTNISDETLAILMNGTDEIREEMVGEILGDNK